MTVKHKSSDAIKPKSYENEKKVIVITAENICYVRQQMFFASQSLIDSSPSSVHCQVYLLRVEYPQYDHNGHRPKDVS